MKKIYLDLGNLKAKNGLYYFAQHLEKFLKDKKYDTEIINDKTVPTNNLVKSSNRGCGRAITIVPTIRFKLKRRVVYFLHDDYPLIQSSITRRIYNKIHFKLCKLFGNVVYISDSLPRRLKLNSYLKLTNLDIMKPTLEANKHDKNRRASVLIVGVETDRKNLNLLTKVLKENADKINSSNVFIVGTMLRGKSNVINDLDATFVPPEELHSIKPLNDFSCYISLSSNEGFNRGAYFALKKGFHLILSKIPEHEEFYNPSYWFDLQTNRLIENHNKSSLKNQSSDNVTSFIKLIDGLLKV